MLRESQSGDVVASSAARYIGLEFRPRFSQPRVSRKRGTRFFEGVSLY